MLPRVSSRRSTADLGPSRIEIRQKGGATRSGHAGVGVTGGISTFAAAVPFGSRPQLDNRARWQRQWCPPSDRPGTLPCLPIVGDPGEPSAQLDGSGKLATPVESSADRRSLVLRHGKHLLSMEMQVADGKLIIGGQPHRCNRARAVSQRANQDYRRGSFLIVCERRPAQSASSA